jgi:phosphoglycerate dehydrogenase-like enzyme
VSTLKVLITLPRERIRVDLADLERLATIEFLEPMDEEALRKAVVDADVLIPGWTVPITAGVIAAAPRLKLIQTFSVGYDNIDATAATNRGIMVCNTGGSNAESVAELAWGLILGLARRIPGGDRLMRAGDWGRFMAERHTLLWGKTLGVIGFGAIGRRVGQIGRLAFHMPLLVHDPFIIPEAAELFGGRLVSLDAVMKESDVISIHVPLSAATRHLLGEAALRRMKPTALLVNTARGAVIDEAALIRCLQDGVIAGAGLDVFEEEPLPAASPLRRLENVILVAHIGTCPEAGVRMHAVGVDNVARFLQGKKPMRVVNPTYLLARTSDAG